MKPLDLLKNNEVSVKTVTTNYPVVFKSTTTTNAQQVVDRLRKAYQVEMQANEQILSILPLVPKEAIAFTSEPASGVPLCVVKHGLRKVYVSIIPIAKSYHRPPQPNETTPQWVGETDEYEAFLGGKWQEEDERLVQCVKWENIEDCLVVLRKATRRKNTPETPQPETTTPKNPQDLMPIRGTPAGMILMNAGKIFRQAHPAVTQVLSPLTQLEQDVPELQLLKVTETSEVFASAGTGKPGRLSAGQTIMLAAIAALAGEQEAIQMLTEATTTKDKQTRGKPAELQETLTALSHSLALRKISQSDESKITNVLTRAALLLFTPAHQIFANEDEAMQLVHQLLAPLQPQDQQYTPQTNPGTSATAYTLMSSLIGGPLPAAKISAPTVHNAIEAYLKYRQVENPNQEQTATAQTHVERTYEASLITGAVNLLARHYLREKQPTEISSAATEMLKGNLPIQLHEVEVVVRTLTPEGEKLIKHRITPATPGKTWRELVQQGFIHSITTEEATPQDYERIRIKGTAGTNNQAIEVQLPVVPGVFLSAIPHYQDTVRFEQGKKTNEQLALFRNWLQQLHGATQDQNTRALLEYVYTQSLYPLELTKSPLYDLGIAQITYETAAEYATYQMAKTQPTSTYTVQRIPYQTPGELQITEPMLHFFKYVGELTDKGIVEGVGIRRMLFFYPQDQDGKRTYRLVALDTRPYRSTEVVVPEEGLKTLLQKMEPTAVPISANTTTVTTDQTPQRTIDIDQPVVVVELMPSATRIPPYGAALGPYLGEKEEEKTQKRIYYVFNPISLEKGKTMRFDPATPFLVQLAASYFV